MITFQAAQGAKPHALTMLFSKFPEVSGVGITRVGDGWGFKVNLTQAPEEKLPAQIDGVPITSEVVGEVNARQMAR